MGSIIIGLGRLVEDLRCFAGVLINRLLQLMMMSHRIIIIGINQLTILIIPLFCIQKLIFMLFTLILFHIPGFVSFVSRQFIFKLSI